MAETSGISWTDATFNPWRGCTEVSPACDNCYAAAMSKRNPAVLGKWGADGTRVVAAEKYWREPLKWNAEAEAAGVRKRVFCASLSDVFEDWTGPMLDHRGKQLYHNVGRWSDVNELIAEEQINNPVRMSDVRQRLFSLIPKTPWLDWLVLTKRPENILRMCPAYGFPDAGILGTLGRRAYLDNVWLGTTVENQEQADKRILELFKCRDLAPVLFLSCEPLLGPVDLSRWMPGSDEYIAPGACEHPRPSDDPVFCRCGYGIRHHRRPLLYANGIDWLITGGESGPHARPSHPDWFRSLRDQCAAAGVPFHHKQNGEWVDELHEAARDATDRKLFDDRFVTLDDGDDYEGLYMVRVGKAKAGRLLDGALHDAFPVDRIGVRL